MGRVYGGGDTAKGNLFSPRRVSTGALRDLFGVTVEGVTIRYSDRRVGLTLEELLSYQTMPKNTGISDHGT